MVDTLDSTHSSANMYVPETSMNYLKNRNRDVVLKRKIFMKSNTIEDESTTANTIG